MGNGEEIRLRVTNRSIKGVEGVGKGVKSYKSVFCAMTNLVFVNGIHQKFLRDMGTVPPLPPVSNIISADNETTRTVWACMSHTK